MTSDLARPPDLVFDPPILGFILDADSATQTISVRVTSEPATYPAPTERCIVVVGGQSVMVRGLGSESRADRAIRLLREAADVLDEIPTRYRASRGVLFTAVTPTTLRSQADSMATSVREARAVLETIDVP